VGELQRKNKEEKLSKRSPCQGLRMWDRTGKGEKVSGPKRKSVLPMSGQVQRHFRIREFLFKLFAPKKSRREGLRIRMRKI